MLTLVDEYSRECLSIDVARRLNSEDVLERLAWMFVTRGIPQFIRSDNGSEFSVRGEAVLEMRVGLSQPSNRTWLQTSLSCGDQESSW